MSIKKKIDEIFGTVSDDLFKESVIVPNQEPVSSDGDGIETSKDEITTDSEEKSDGK